MVPAEAPLHPTVFIYLPFENILHHGKSREDEPKSSPFSKCSTRVDEIVVNDTEERYEYRQTHCRDPMDPTTLISQVNCMYKTLIR
jgi:hypothetical protein